MLGGVDFDKKMTARKATQELGFWKIHQAVSVSDLKSGIAPPPPKKITQRSSFYSSTSSHLIQQINKQDVSKFFFSK